MRNSGALIPVSVLAGVLIVAAALVLWGAQRGGSSDPAGATAEDGGRAAGFGEASDPDAASAPSDRVTKGYWGAEGDRAAQGANSPVTNGASNVLAAIRELESARDPKCHSTACRFEDFIYGTPLDDDARRAKVELQKALIGRIWHDAAERAVAAGRSTVGESDIRGAVEQIVQKTATDDDAITVRFGGAEPIEISPVRVRQMATIAYSLRAILSVQQDALFGDVPAPLPLDATSIEPLRAAVDTVTLCALQLADIAARRANEPRVSADMLRDSWRRLVGNAPPEARAARRRGNDVASTGRNTDLRRQLFAMIDGKLIAYERYNATTPLRAQQRFLKNVKDYYALFKMPIRDEWINRLMYAYRREMVDFAVRLVAKAGESSGGSQLLRPVDASAAVARLLPHRIDDFEDVTFFPKLAAERITLESYDCDSFRDTGFHWRFLRDAYTGDPTAVPTDPFAAEILTEAVSDYGVLLWRMAGRVAGARNDAPALRPHHLEEARRRIATLAKGHHDAPPLDRSAAGIRSAHEMAPSVANVAFFTDVSDRLGVAYQHDSSTWLHEFRRDSVSSYPTFSGGGVAAEDIDGDGHLDLLFVGGGGNALYWGDGRGDFHEETPDLLLAQRADSSPGEARQPLIADFDNDGRQDIFISYAGDRHRLFRNLGDRRLEDVSATAGLGGNGLIGGPATTFDFDGDGLLDVYITYFGDYLHGAAPREERNNTNALPNKLFRNLGGMKFQDVTEESGTDDTGWCQAVSHTDFDRDGRQDIVVANDFGRNALLRNLGNGRFENVGPTIGHTKAYHSMNVGITDINRDGYPDIYISNIATMVKDNKYVFPDVNTPQKLDLSALSNMLVKEANVLYISRAGAGRLDRYEPSGDIERGESSTGWAWDAEFLDFDNDGDDDLYVTNGTNDYNVFSRVVSIGDRATGRRRHVQLSNRREANVFYVNDAGRLKNRSSESGADFAGNSRSTAYLDWDDDGDLDMAVANFHSPAVMLQNNSARQGHHWIKVRLMGDPEKKTNRDAIGGRIIATNDEGLYLVREIQGGSGYLSQNPKEQHFGVGTAAHVDLTIHWPNGDVQRLAGLPVERRHVIQQGKPPGR